MAWVRGIAVVVLVGALAGMVSGAAMFAFMSAFTGSGSASASGRDILRFMTGCSAVAILAAVGIAVSVIVAPRSSR